MGHSYVKLDVVKAKKQSVLLPAESMLSASQSTCCHFFPLMTCVVRCFVSSFCVSLIINAGSFCVPLIINAESNEDKAKSKFTEISAKRVQLGAGRTVVGEMLA